MDDDLLYMRNRFYTPSLERFLSEDPIGLMGGDVSFYRYVANDLVNWIDPWGLEQWHTPDGTHRVGRPGTIVPPGGSPGTAIENKVGSGYTFGDVHDGLVKKATDAGTPDSIINIPSMIPAYLKSILPFYLSFKIPLRSISSLSVVNHSR